MDDLLIDEINENAIKKHYSDRTVVLDCEINDAILTNIILHILLWNKEDKGMPTENRKPIKIYIDSEGGSTFAANNLIDVISTSKTPVWGIGFSMVASAAFSIFISCHKRYGFKHTVYLIHDGLKTVFDSGSKARDLMDFLDRMDDVDKQLILKHTSISEEEYEQKKRKEQFLFSEEAKEKGIVDSIIGTDCTIDEIL